LAEESGTAEEKILKGSVSCYLLDISMAFGSLGSLQLPPKWRADGYKIGTALAMQRPLSTEAPKIVKALAGG
jgi:hypothetical protein